MIGCKCNGEIFVDSMCGFCLEQVEQHLMNKMLNLEEQIMDIDANLDEVRFYLYDAEDKYDEDEYDDFDDEEIEDELDCDFKKRNN